MAQNIMELYINGLNYPALTKWPTGAIMTCCKLKIVKAS